MSSVYRVKASACQDENLVTHYLNCPLTYKQPPGPVSPQSSRWADSSNVPCVKLRDSALVTLSVAKSAGFADWSGRSRLTQAWQRGFAAWVRQSHREKQHNQVSRVRTGTDTACSSIGDAIYSVLMCRNSSYLRNTMTTDSIMS